MTENLNPVQQPPAAAPAPAAPAVPQAAPGPDPNDPEFVAFQAQMQRYLGFGVADLKGSVETIQQLAREREATLLRNTWGASHDDNFNAVQSRLSEMYKTNPSLAESLNNAAGAQLVHAQLQIEAQAANQAAAVPGFQRSYSPAQPGSQSTPLFKSSDIKAMSKDERRNRHFEIAAAYQNGLVSND